MYKSVLITGATGNVGSFVAKEMQEHGYHVLALCHSEQSENIARESGYQVVKGDLTTPERWIEIVEQVDGLIHTACTFKGNMGSTDFTFIHSVSERVKKNDFRFVYTTGCWVHGEHEIVIDESTPEVPVNDFSWMKDNREWLFKQNNLNACAVSPANVVNAKHRYVPEILHLDFQTHSVLRLPTHIDATIALVSVEALTSLYRLAFESGKHGETYIGVTDPEVPFHSFMSRLTDTPDQLMCKSNCIEQWIEDYGTWAEGYALKQVFTSQKAIEELGWRPEPIYAANTTE